MLLTKTSSCLHLYSKSVPYFNFGLELNNLLQQSEVRRIDESTHVSFQLYYLQFQFSRVGYTKTAIDSRLAF